MIKSITDITGVPVFYEQSVCQHMIEENISVLQQPALLFSIKDKNMRYYYRSLEWNSNLLVCAEKKLETHSYVVQHCQLNPPSDYLITLLKDAEILYG